MLAAPPENLQFWFTERISTDPRPPSVTVFDEDGNQLDTTSVDRRSERSVSPDCRGLRIFSRHVYRELVGAIRRRRPHAERDVWLSHWHRPRSRSGYRRWRASSTLGCRLALDHLPWRRRRGRRTALDRIQRSSRLRQAASAPRRGRPGRRHDRADCDAAGTAAAITFSTGGRHQTHLFGSSCRTAGSLVAAPCWTRDCNCGPDRDAFLPHEERVETSLVSPAQLERLARCLG